MRRRIASQVFAGVFAFSPFLPFWQDQVAPKVAQGERIIISAHGNTLRAFVKYLDQVSDDRIPELEIPTGTPLVYELDSSLTPRAGYYLGDSPAAQEAEAEMKDEK